MIDLREKDLQAIRAIAQATLPGSAEVWAYGSRVRGGAHAASDLDLAVKTPEDSPLSERQFAGFVDGLQESGIPIIIQVMDWHRMPAHFKSGIAREHFVVWGEGETGL